MTISTELSEAEHKAAAEIKKAYLASTNAVQQHLYTWFYSEQTWAAKHPLVYGAACAFIGMIFAFVVSHL